jgi:hypothetical protein
MLQVAETHQILNDEIGSTLTLDLAAEDELARIAKKVANIEKSIQSIDNNISHNKIDHNTKANKPLQKRKKRLTSHKNELTKE